MTSKQAQVSAFALVGISLGSLTYPSLAGDGPDPNRLAHSKDAVRSRLIVLQAGKDGDS